MHIEPAPNLGGLRPENYQQQSNRRNHRDPRGHSDTSLVPPSGARRLDTDDDLLIYEDIYPKRVPNAIHREWNPDPFAHSAAGERQFSSSGEGPFSSSGSAEHPFSNSGPERPFSNSGPERPFSNSGERWRTSSIGSSPSSSGTRPRLSRGRKRHERLSRMRAQRRARKQHLIREHRARSHSSDNELSFRSMLGVAPYCLSDDSQFSCMFTPMCWMAGGIPQAGCESFLYSCCVAPTLARKVSPMNNYKFVNFSQLMPVKPFTFRRISFPHQLPRSR